MHVKTNTRHAPLSSLMCYWGSLCRRYFLNKSPKCKQVMSIVYDVVELSARPTGGIQGGTVLFTSAEN